MKKKVVFIIYRTNEFKYLCSTIDAFYYKKIPIEILFLSDENKNSFKYYLNSKRLKSSILNKIPKLYFTNSINLQNYFVKNIKNISFIFSLVFLSKNRFLIDKKFLNLVKNKWCVMNHGTDNFAQLKDEKTYYEYNPTFFADTNYYLKFGKKWLKKYVNKKTIFSAKKIKFKVVGNSMYSKKVFKKDFKSKNKSLIYLPYPYLKERYNADFAFQAAFVGRFINMYYFYRKYHKASIFYAFSRQIIHILTNSYEILRNFGLIKKYYYFENEFQIVKKISKFCKKNNLKFIIKPRLKFPFPKLYHNYADKIIYDDESKQFPSLFQKELVNSKIVIGHNSSAIYETAMFKKISINIEVPKIAFHSKSSKALFTFLPNSEWNFNKVVYNFKIKEFLDKFDKINIKNLEINNKQHKKYISKFCGISKKYDTGERIYNEIKNYLK